jgi:hypothetical protein
LLLISHSPSPAAMSSHDFDTALRDIGSDASGTRLCELISAATFAGEKGLPATAERFLRAFCNGKLSLLQRRWIGLSLATMMHESKSVVAHLGRLSQDLHHLGRVVLQHGEPEELKIMAGLIMRLGVENDIDFSNFWGSDKVKNSLPPFPTKYNPRWFMDFEKFLDMLGGLGLINPETEDLVVVYPVAVLDSDGFKWGHTDVAVGIAQSAHLTVIAPDYTLGEHQFIDIPLSHVLSVDTSESLPFDSQPDHGRPISKLYGVELVLKSESWTYHLNSSEHTAGKITFQFVTAQEAAEWEECIKEYQREASSAKPVPPPAGNSRSRRLRSHSPRRDQDGDDVGSSKQPSPRRAHLRSSHCSDPIDISRPRSNRSARQVDKPLEPHEEDDQTLVEDSYPLADAARAQELQQLDSPEPSRSTARNDGKLGQSVETDMLDEVRDGQDSASKLTVAEDRKGKLPKVSRAMKVNAIQPRQKQTQDPGATQGRTTRQVTRKTKAASSNPSDDDSPPPQKSQAKSKSASHAPAAVSKGKKAQSRRKAEDDDDEFIPNQPSPKTKKGGKRKRAGGAVNDDDQPKKKTRAGPATAPISSPPVKPKTRKTEPQRGEGPEPALSQKEVNTEGTKQKPTEPRPSSMPPPRNTLIGGLVRSQKSPKASTTASKGPSQSTWNNQTPSTPTKSYRSRPTSRHLFEAQRHTGQSPAQFASSPMVGSSIRGDRSMTREAFADLEIMSSNTKRGPASPHAESTAISGHADQDEVDMEKEIADNETARSDPFKRRSGQNKLTTFTRRLTSEHSAIDDIDIPEDQASTLPAGLGYDDTLEDELAPIVAEPLLSERSPKRVTKNRTLGVERSDDQSADRGTQSSYLAGMQKLAMKQSRAASPKLPRPLDEELPFKPQSPSRVTRQAHAKTGRYASRRQATTAKVLGTHAARVREQRPRIIQGELLSNAPKQTSHVNKPDYQPESEENVYGEDDTTLVNDRDNIDPDLQFLSSPPVPWSNGTHSSTSAGPDLTPGPSPPTSQIEEMEWDASLRPEQRPLRDLLARVSNKVLQHVFDNESAVSDIAEEFCRDGQHLLDSMLERHGAQYAGAFEDLEEKKQLLREELEAATRTLVEERARIHAGDSTCTT